jgi:circadian clock protein KaiC
MGMRVASHVESGHIKIRQIDPAELSPGELVHEIREAVNLHEARVIVIDSLNGYLNAMPDERFLISQLHELLSFLGQHGVATFLVGAQHGVLGTQMSMPIDASYLADAVIMLRYYETQGEVRQAISVLKKRSGVHERTIRAMSMSDSGVHIGGALRSYRGILSGIPEPVDTPPDSA